MKALVLSGGGARGAYQVGVLTALAEVASREGIKSPFQIYTGVSAGAINASHLASGAHDFPTSVKKLEKLWSELHSHQVFKTDAISLGKIGLQWMGELSFGALAGTKGRLSLLNTDPLAELLSHDLEFSKIQKNIDDGHLHALALTALDYRTSTAITFVQGAPHTKMWNRARRFSEATKIGVEHIMASSAIPLLFPPIQVGERWFGDGCIRNLAPLSPSLHMGAADLFVIGVRTSLEQESAPASTSQNPSVARVANVVLNSVLLDGIDVDIERLNRINEFVLRIPPEHQRNLNFKSINYQWIRPTGDIGAVAATMSSRLPRLIRYLLKGLGPLEDASEIMSYLMFEPDFNKKLIEMGYNDGIAQKSQMEKFLRSPA